MQNNFYGSNEKEKEKAKERKKGASLLSWQSRKEKKKRKKTPRDKQINASVNAQETHDQRPGRHVV